MRIDTGTPHGGMWVTLDDNSKIHCKVEPVTGFAEFSFFGSVEVSLSMSEASLVRCRDMFTTALDNLHRDEDERSWMHPAAPTD